MMLLSKLLPADKALRKNKSRIHLFTVFKNLSIVMSRSRYLFFMVCSALFFQIGTEAFYLAAPILAVNKFHMGPPMIGNYFMMFGVIAALVSWWVNAKINHHFKNPRHVYLACMFLYSCTIGLLIIANTQFIFILPFFSVGIFGVLAWIQVNNLFSQAVDESEQGLVFGVSQSMWSLGGMIGTLLVGLSSAIHEKIMVSLPVSFILLGLIACILMVTEFGKKTEY